ncbi:hypothetical protein GO003_014640 [Methylicorpusculum oleiharenae]|uniref:hypothetical protein n=1 Tax=Methylicorpusculum oleiharenae TaxID=1338687 RepID=UPI00135AA829|nr:hypothetical protein [Methylicorpusculum oleiharenae]MCD2451630.1 hypothetical protein [Methylicorpusculum oleiharenae]
MKDYFLKRQKAKSLAAEIKAMERQILLRQHVIHMRGDCLVKKLRQQLSEPTTFLLAGGIGFVFGELTKCQSIQSSGTSDQSKTAEPSPLINALNLFTTARTLYMALPIAWMMKSSGPREQTPSGDAAK